MNRVCVENRILLEEVSRLIEEGHDVTILAKGNSMDPFIRGEMDSVKLSKPSDVKVGDIVLARLSAGKYVLHRVFAIEDENLTLMGDGNLNGKEHCRLHDVMGKVVAIVAPSGRERRLTDGRVWRKLMPLRRIMLGVYHRVYRREYNKEFYGKKK